MKSIAVTLVLFITFSDFSQTNDNNVKSIQIFSDSIDNIINNSTGFPGEVFCNTITMKRNVRVIGMQDTKISFYYMQKEDSVYDDGKIVQFIPQYNPPLKIHIEYNIAASQMEYYSYYFDNSGKLIYYLWISNGEYGSSKKQYWFDNFKLLKIEGFKAHDKGSVINKTGNFTVDEQKSALEIMENAVSYVEEYYNLFKIELIDK